MAVDEAILVAVGKGDVLPTLRLYSWEPACLSVGFSQKIGEVDRERLNEKGWDLVRRPTGGRAILHIDELTYSVSGPEDDPRLAGGVLKSYANLAKGLACGLERLGLDVHADEKYAAIPGGEKSSPACFEAPSNFEITANGKKLIGSAQARRREGVLQHGSLPLWGDLTRIVQALVFETEEDRAQAGKRLGEHAVTLENALGRQVSWGSVADHLKTGFAETLNLAWVEDTLSPFEIETARVLVEEKYSSPGWTGRL